MKLVSRSKRRKKSELQEIAAFVMARTPLRSNVVITFRDSTEDEGGYFTYGRATMDRTHGKVSTSIDIRLSRDICYPAIIPEHVQEVGDVNAATWQEELVLVLGHEAKHLFYWENGFFLRGQEHACEVSAERHGVAVLNSWIESTTDALQQAA